MEESLKNSNATEPQTGVKFCEVCKISCTGIISLETHKKGKKHIAKLKQLHAEAINSAGDDTDGDEEASKPNGNSTTQPEKIYPLECKYCKKKFNGQNPAKDHFKSKAHQKKKLTAKTVDIENDKRKLEEDEDSPSEEEKAKKIKLDNEYAFKPRPGNAEFEDCKD